MTTIRHSIVDSTDVDEHAASLSDWSQKYEQVSPGRFKGRLDVLSLGPVQVFRETMHQAVLMRTATAPNIVAVGAPVGDQSQGWFCGRPVDETHIVRLATGREFELATRGDFDLAVVGVDLDFLNNYSRQIDGIESFSTLDHHQIVTGGATDSSTLRELLLATLATARDSPKLLEQEPLRRALVRSLCDELIACSNQPRTKGGATDATVATRQRVVREARHYMSQHADVAISVPDLCEAIHVSRRTLQYSFQDVLQMSPVAYLRALRLNGMRRDLRHGGPESVGDRAARWGFWHLSHFAADYRHMFGELPSATLQRARTTPSQI